MATIHRKANLNEIIEVGDVLMVSPENQCVTKAFRDSNGINERLVVGVCSGSDNKTKMPIRIIGGKSVMPELHTLINGGNSSVNVIPLKCGDSKERPRLIVSIETSGKQLVNVAHNVDIGDSLTICRKHKGKAEAVDLLNHNRFTNRTIGKVIRYTNNKNQVMCLLDIE